MEQDVKQVHDIYMTRETHISIYFNKMIIKGILNDEKSAQR